jgi:hypothetical protein
VLVLCCVGSGLCDELITLSEASYRVYMCRIMCDLKSSTVRRPKPELGCCTTEIKKELGEGKTSPCSGGIYRLAKRRPHATRTVKERLHSQRWKVLDHLPYDPVTCRPSHESAVDSGQITSRTHGAVVSTSTP